MITKKQLIEFIKHSPDDANITIFGIGEIIHIIQDGDILLSAHKPIGYCHKCGNYVYPEYTQGLEQYEGVCLNCDENMFKFEIEPLEDKEDE